MKMYRTQNFMLATSERGMAAGCLLDLQHHDEEIRWRTQEIIRLWSEPESFLRIAYVLCWLPEGHVAVSGLINNLGSLPPLWERPDPAYAVWDCHDQLIAEDWRCNYAPVNKDCPNAEIWKSRDAFMMHNAQGKVFWAEQDREAQECIRTRGKLLWWVPE